MRLTALSPFFAFSCSLSSSVRTCSSSARTPSSSMLAAVRVALCWQSRVRDAHAQQPLGPGRSPQIRLSPIFCAHCPVLPGRSSSLRMLLNFSIALRQNHALEGHKGTHIFNVGSYLCVLHTLTSNAFQFLQIVLQSLSCHGQNCFVLAHQLCKLRLLSDPSRPLLLVVHVAKQLFGDSVCPTFEDSNLLPRVLTNSSSRCSFLARIVA